MNRPALIRAIYSELRASLGPQVPSGDLIKIANAILRGYGSHVTPPPDEFGIARPSRAIEFLPVDEAWNQGWRLVRFERESHSTTFDDWDPEVRAAVIHKLRGYLGPEWRIPI